MLLATLAYVDAALAAARTARRPLGETLLREFSMPAQL